MKNVQALLILACVVCAPPLRAQPQTAAQVYARAGELEQTARAAPTVATLRRAIGAFEQVVRKYPKSGFCDNALLQGAAMATLTFERFGEEFDRRTAERLLSWLVREYPTSPLAAEARLRLETLPARRPAGPPAGPAVPPAPPGAASPIRAVPPPKAVTGSPAVLRDITRSTLPLGDRITIELDHETAFTSERLANPDRVFFDLRHTSVPASILDRIQALTSPHVQSVRIGRQAEGTTRVVLTLAGGPRHSVFPLTNPFRLVIDLETGPPALLAGGPAVALRPAPSPPAPPPAPTTAGQGRTSPLPPAPLPVAAPGLPATPSATRRGDYSLARQLGLGVARVVIDAGHGGHDPGARANGINEAELVLDVALRLEKLLKQLPGVDVVLTRRSDEFIPLEERTAIANREDADLFLSIHANASGRAAARGVETYFLNFATHPEAEALAARENATSGQTMAHLGRIVERIALNNKLDESRELASMVQTSLVRRLRIQNKALRDLGVKQAPFVVLIGAEMPSVLAEMAFVTNRTEAALLKQGAYRQRVAQALCDAVLKYQTSLKKTTTVATRPR